MWQELSNDTIPKGSAIYPRKDKLSLHPLKLGQLLPRTSIPDITGSSAPTCDSEAQLSGRQQAGRGLSTGLSPQGPAQASPSTRSHICVKASAICQPLLVCRATSELDVLALPHGCHCFFFVWGYFYIQWHSTPIFCCLNQCLQLPKSI